MEVKRQPKTPIQALFGHHRPTNRTNLSQFNIKPTSPAATVYLCQRSSKLQEE